MTTNSIKLPIIDVIVRRTIATDVGLISLAVAALALSAQIKVMTVPVPVTLQTMMVLLIGAALGASRGVIATGTYLALGAAGLPIFSGAQTLAGAIHTTGYLVGFVAASAIIGRFADLGLLAKWGWTALAFTLGSLTIYVLGVTGLMLSPLQLTFEQAIAGGVLPFLVFDSIKAAAAAAMLPIAWKLVGSKR